MKILTATKQQQVADCYPVMSQLRPHLDKDTFQQKVTRQIENGYQLVYLVDHKNIQAVAGYRIGNSLAWGKFLYIEDLVTDQDSRSKGYGKKLLDWLLNEAKQQQCDQLHLDSGMQRVDAHRFYERENLVFSSKHFTYIF